MLVEKDIDSHTKLVTLDTQRLDVLNAGTLKRQIQSLIEETPNRLVMDFHTVNFIDSSGLGVLVGLLKKAGAPDRLVICNLQPPIAEIFGMTNMDRVFSIYPSVDEALAAKAG